jgi:putative endonuclease
MSVKDAATFVSQTLGVSRKIVYQIALPSTARDRPMPFDFVPSRLPAPASRAGCELSAGHAAEASVARHYEDRGIAICARNWRGITGEIDLIGRDGDVVIFIEVKQSKTHDLAAAMSRRAQIGRIFATVDEFVAGEPKGLLTDVERIDLALVDGMGRIDVVIENAFAWTELHLPAASVITLPKSERRSEPWP